MEKINWRFFWSGFIFFLLVILFWSGFAAAAENWSPWLVTRQNLTREQFAQALERNDRKLLRVDTREFAKIWGNMGLPVMEDHRQVAAFIRSGEVTEVPCTSELINRLHLARVNRTGEVDFNFARKACYTGEKFLAWRRQIFVSLGCGNPAQEREQSRPTIVPVPPRPVRMAELPKGCPEMYTLKVNVWPSSALAFPGVAQAIAAAEVASGAGFRDESRLSRHLDGALRAEAALNSSFQRSQTSRLFRMSLIRVDQSDRVTAEQPLGDHEVAGLREFKFTRAQLQWDAIRILDLREEMRSPVFHSKTSLREIRFYNTRIFQGLPMGEWSTNPIPDCVMNVHAIEQSEGNLPVTMSDGTQSLPPPSSALVFSIIRD